MDFSFSDDHLEIRDQVRAALAELCPPSAVRQAWHAMPGQTDRRAWAALTRMGALDLLVPEDAGGLGFDEIPLVLLLEESGYAALPDPLVETAAVAMPLVAGRVEAGTVITTDLGGPMVPWAGDAGQLLLTAADGELHLVGAEEVTVEEVATVDGARRAGRVRWRPSAGTALPAGSAARRRALHRGTLGTAAVLIGLGRRMLDMTVAYVSERRQFGVPVGSFQAVKHHLADAATALEFATSVVRRAAWSLSTGHPDGARDVSMAKAMASDAATRTGRAALQCHGAIGYTVEYDLHLFLKRAASLARSWGDAATHRRVVGAAAGV